MSLTVRYHPYNSYNPDAAVHLLNALLNFYHNEQTWVSRTRASIELALVQGPLQPHSDNPGIDSPSASPSGSSSAFNPPDSLSLSDPPASVSTRSSTSIINSLPLSIASDTDSSDEFKPDYDDENVPSLPMQIRPLSVRALTEKRKSVHSRWHKRKQQFNLHLGPLNQQAPQRKRRIQGPDHGTQLLELFGDLVNTRMQSCMRVSRMVCDANVEISSSAYYEC